MPDHVIHFAPWGTPVTACGRAVTKYPLTATVDRANTTCPGCRENFTNPTDTPTPPSESLIAKLIHAADLGTGGTQRTDLFRAAADALEKAPHSPGCATTDSRRVYEFPPCDCWKSNL